MVKEMEALILSGGLGTRLRPLSLYTPKPLLPVANIPFLAYPMSLLRKHGIGEVVLCTSDSLSPYENFISDQKKLGTTVVCSREYKELGTAGAIKKAEKFVNSQAFIFNGDILTDIDLTAMVRFHREKKSSLTVALVAVPDPSAYGLVIVDASGKILKFIEKPPVGKSKLRSTNSYLINFGFYIFEREIFDRIPCNKKYSAERELFPDCLAEGVPMFGFVTKSSTYWLDIGTPEKYLQANKDVLSKRLSKVFSMREVHSVGKKNYIHRTAVIRDDVTIGNRCHIGAKSILKNCIIMNNVLVEDEVTLDGCIIGSHSKIAHHSSIVSSKVVGNYSVISPFSRL